MDERESGPSLEERFRREESKPRRIVLLRHGESEWNLENRFSGWVDVDLTEKGIEEAREAGRILAEENYSFDYAHASVLKRAAKTLTSVLDEMDLTGIPVRKSWRLNERHYGALAGLNKAETAEKYGEEQVRVWRRSYDARPPLLEENDPGNPANAPVYGNVASPLPRGESLKDTMDRTVPYWKAAVMPQIEGPGSVLVVASNNSLRALVKHIEKVPDDEISGIDIPTGVPLAYEFDRHRKPLKSRYLGDQTELQKKIKDVKAHGTVGYRG